MRTAAAILLFPIAIVAILALAITLSVVLSPVYAYLICRSVATPKKPADGNPEGPSSEG